MIPMSFVALAEVVGGRLHDVPADGEVVGPATVDSRSVEPGGLFVAIAGERVDGHEYAAAAVAAGAALVLGARPTGVPTVVVDDPVEALGRLARHVVDVLRAGGTRVVALTGSQGKTGTKDYLAEVLGADGPTVATAGNLNNEIGVPLTVLRAGPGTRHLVVEMGARGVGHIAHLCRIATPHVGVVLNVGTAHLGEFGSREAIARAKGELVEGLPGNGVAVLNADDPLVVGMAGRTTATVRTFGRGEAGPADVTATQVELDALGRARFLLTEDGRTAPVRLRLTGGHQVDNALAAATAARALGVGLDRVAEALSAASAASPWRMALHERPDGTLVVNDAYNANPESMRAALDTLVVLGQRRGARTVAVLGEMKELGAGADEAHRAVGEYAAAAGVDVLVLVGEAGERMAEGAARAAGWGGEAVHRPGREEATTWVRENVSVGDVVLVKASRGIALEHLADALAGPGEEGVDDR